MDKPSVGRIVHYVAYGTPGGEFPSGVCRAAIVTEVDPVDQSQPDGGETPAGIPQTIGIMVANPSGLFFNRHIPYDGEKAPGSWHWPERV